MRAPLAFAATCTAVSAVLLLSACGGGSGDGNDKITKASSTPPPSPSATTTSASASPSASGVKRPTFDWPSDAKDVFEDQHTGDAKKDAILADSQGYAMALDDAFLKGTASTPAVNFYAVGQGITKAVEFVKGTTDDNDSWTGTVRYFDRKVTLNDDGSASVVYCSDESKAFLKDRTTGKVTRDAPSAQSYVLYQTHMKKNAQGVWQTTNIIGDRGAKKCQP